MQGQDYLVRAMLGNNQARLFALRTSEMARTAQSHHETTPVATAALGRTLTMGLVLGAMLKGDETISIQIKGDGPLGGIVVSANSRGAVKGYVGNPHVDLPLSPGGKLAVGAAVGSGNLYVIRDLGLKEAYQGTVPLQTGEIGEDFAYYFTHSEQTPSAVGLGVLVGVDGIPISSGGLVVQLLPDASLDSQFVSDLETSLSEMPAISSLFAEGQSVEEIVESLFPTLPLRFIDTAEVAFRCDCSWQRFEQALITLGVDELRDLVAGGETIETICHFCNQRYNFTVEQLEIILNELGNSRE
ncbi:MAG: Hsp33 family molecular chaperone HslO [Limnochordia bacterium]|nr:Hsp33 family molecular chaperone HslO [Limnochordia bacterium]